MIDATFVELTFDDILPYWKAAWPHSNNIYPVNYAEFLTGHYNPEGQYGKVHYYGIKVNNHIVGINSVYKTGAKIVRTRGLFVEPDYRRQGYGEELIRHIDDIAVSLDCYFVWGYPRVSTMNLWKRCGWQAVSKPFNTMDYGPHVWACRVIPIVDA